MTTLVADIETNGLLPTLDTVWQISIIDVDKPDRVDSYNLAREVIGFGVGVAVDRMAAADHLIMHNGLGFDLPAIMKVFGEPYAGWPGLDWTRVIDTLVLSRLGNPPRPGGHSLEAWAPRLGTEVSKVEHEDWSKWSPEMEHRCNIDAKITLGVYNRLKGMYDAMPEAVAIEHAVAHEVRKVIDRGFKLDVPHAVSLLSDLQSEQERQLVEFVTKFPPIFVPKKPSDPIKVLKVINKNHPLHGQLDPGVPYCPIVVQEFNPASRQQIAQRFIKRYGWKPTKFTDSGLPEVSEDILRDLQYPEAKDLADYLVTDKMISQINSKPKSNGFGGGWLHWVKEDGRVHANLNPLKAVTGRLSCSSPNVQQAHKDKRMRAAWVPTAGKVLVGCDAEGLELRCLSHYLWPMDGGAYAKMLLEGDKKAGTDVHSVVMGLLGFYDRDETKRAEYGWLYGAGDAKLGIICYQDAYKAGKEIDYAGLGFSKRASNSAVGKVLRARLEEGITGLKDLVEGVKTKAKYDGKIRGLDGRTLWIRSQHSALNFLLQSAGIIIVKKAWTLMGPEFARHGFVEGRDYGMVMQVHDEFQFETDASVADDVGTIASNCIVEAGKQLGFRCPLAGDFKVGSNWAETH